MKNHSQKSNYYSLSLEKALSYIVAFVDTWKHVQVLSCAAGMMHVLSPMNGQKCERRGAKMIPRQGEFSAAMGGTQWRCP